MTCATGIDPVEFAETIITTHLLEQIGGQWYQHRTVRHIKGLTFIEDRTSNDDHGP